MLLKIGNQWLVNHIILPVKNNATIKKTLCDVLSLVFSFITTIGLWVGFSVLTIKMIDCIYDVDMALTPPVLVVVYMGWLAILAFKVVVKVHSIFDKILDWLIKRAFGQWVVDSLNR